MRIPAAAAIVLLVLLAVPDVASACSCPDTRPRTADDYMRWLQNYPGSVFQGQVTRVEPGPTVVTAPDLPPLRTWKVTFTVDRQWKGVGTRAVVVSTPFDDATCGVAFKPGGRYLIAVEMQRGMLDASVCSSGWMHTQDEQAFYAALGPGALPSSR